MKLYLAGPMRGYPKSNFPAFHEAAASLRAAGHEVFNPAEKAEEIRRTTTGFSLRAAFALDTAYICAHAEGIAMLPGWRASKGAVAEHALAEALGLTVMHLPLPRPYPVARGPQPHPADEIAMGEPYDTFGG